jgi:hypothetical protein
VAAGVWKEQKNSARDSKQISFVVAGGTSIAPWMPTVRQSISA